MSDEAKMSGKGTIYLSGGEYGGTQSYTAESNNEVGIYGKAHRWCGNREQIVYRRRGKSNPFFDFAEIDHTDETCNICEKQREESKVREAERKYKESIEVVYEIDDGSGYDWDTAQLGISPDGRLWYRYGSGCSCDSIESEEWQEMREVENARMACRHIGSATDRAGFIAKAQTMIGERV